MKAHRFRRIAGALGFVLGIGALIVLSVNSIHDGLTVGSRAGKGGGAPTGNATALTKPPRMQFGQTAGEESTTTTTPATR